MIGKECLNVIINGQKVSASPNQKFPRKFYLSLAGKFRIATVFYISAGNLILQCNSALTTEIFDHSQLLRREM